jgi:hypothetical protein
LDEEKLIILVQGHVCLYNLQYNGYDNSLVKDNCWREIAGEWQCSGMVAAGERHGMCESAFSHPEREGGTFFPNAGILLFCKEEELPRL